MIYCVLVLFNSGSMSCRSTHQPAQPQWICVRHPVQRVNRRADLPQENSEFIYRRMESDRLRIANRIRATGQEQSNKIRANADREQSIIVAEAQKDAQILRGEGDGDHEGDDGAAHGGEYPP